MLNEKLAGRLGILTGNVMMNIKARRSVVQASWLSPEAGGVQTPLCPRETDYKRGRVQIGGDENRTQRTRGEKKKKRVHSQKTKPWPYSDEASTIKKNTQKRGGCFISCLAASLLTNGILIAKERHTCQAAMVASNRGGSACVRAWYNRTQLVAAVQTPVRLDLTEIKMSPWLLN